MLAILVLFVTFLLMKPADVQGRDGGHGSGYSSGFSGGHAGGYGGGAWSYSGGYAHGYSHTYHWGYGHGGWGYPYRWGYPYHWGYPYWWGYRWGYPYWWGYPYYSSYGPYYDLYYDPYFYEGYGGPAVTSEGGTPPAESGQQSSYWHFCQNPEGYYPYVKDCPTGWMTVVPPKPNAAPPSRLGAPVFAVFPPDKKHEK